tara:strand:- start:96420 stop:97043 length:624 start_codon:yes stop_codon:yes gene_type:complete
MRISCLILFLILFSSPGLSETSFQFDVDKDWRGERIELPPKFAQAMTWKGTEVIRFAPGMFQVESETFFTYVIVFLLDPASDVTPKATQQQLLHYFQGLASSVSRGKRRAVDVDGFQLELGSWQKKSVDRRERETTTGTLKWVEPFRTMSNQTLQLRVEKWNHADQPAILVTLSPQPFDHSVWNELGRIAKTFRFGDESSDERAKNN